MSEHIVGVSPREYNGKQFRSTLEAHTAETLDKMGVPWEYETKKIVLQEGFYCQYQKERVRAIEYTPDFIIGPIMLETKGFETPDWKIKKKLLYKHLKENDPQAIFYMIKNDRQLLQSLDNHWQYLGYAIKVTPKSKTSKKAAFKASTVVPKVSALGSTLYDSISQAMDDLSLKGKPITPILRSLTGKTEYVYGYKWQLHKLKL